MLRKAVVILALLGLLPGGAAAQKVKGMKVSSTTEKVSTSSSNILPFRAVEKTLANGLKVIVVPTGFPNIVSLQIPVQTGSRNEVEPGKSGFAHFFEHMMFRGTKQYPPDKYQAILTEIGARQNAYTTDDYTNYHTTFAKEDLEIMLKIEADRFMNLEYSEEDFKTEARAVLGEYNKNYANPFSKLLEVQQENAFTRHTYKHTTMGFLKDIEDMPNQFQYSKEFFKRWYRPEYTAIIVAGDVEPEKVLAMVEKYWGAWQTGNYKAEIPQEPVSKAPVYAHVPWSSPTLPIVTVAFRSPAFSENEKDQAALSMAFDLYFGRTSEIYKKLVEKEQKVDFVGAGVADNADPALTTVFARLKKLEDATYVRDAIMETLAKMRAEQVSPERLVEAKSNARYGFLRTLDNTESIASVLATYVRYHRSYDTINNIYKVYDSLTPTDLQQAAKKYIYDENLVITTLSQQAMPEEVKAFKPLSAYEKSSSSNSSSSLQFVVQKTPLPQINMKFLFNVGSAYDPVGKEGLAALSASMIANAGSKDLRIDEINKALFPIAASFFSQVDKEMTTFTGIVHKDNLKTFAEVALKQLSDPGFREEDFKRLKQVQLNSLTQDLRANNEEELAKERLQQHIFAGSSYGHPVLGTVAGIEAITIEDVKQFIKTYYTQSNVTVGLSGDLPESLSENLKNELAKLPQSSSDAKKIEVAAKMPNGIEVEIIEKDTLATAISFGFPIEVNRSHPDFAALWLARAWLGEHRSSVSHLYQRIREIRGMNYGDYAYIEAFPRGMFQFFPDPNIARRKQIFEIWIRPVVPQNAQMAIRIAQHELEKLVEKGLSEEDFKAMKNYLMKNVFVMTATQNQQLGYALDSRWYNIGEFTSYMREKLQNLTVDEVNRVIKKHLQTKNLNMVIITKDAKSLREQLIADGFSEIKYDASKPQDLLEEDKVIGARKLNIRPEAIKITPVSDVFAK